LFTGPRCYSSGYSWNHQVPRAPSHVRGVTSHAVAACSTSAGVTPPSLLLQAHAPVLTPPTAYGHSLGQRVFAGRCQPRLADRTFPALPPRILPQMPGPLPRRSPWCTYSFLPTGHRPSPFPNQVGTPQSPYNDVSTGFHFEAAAIHSCSGLWVCSPPRSFPPQRSLRVKRLRRRCRVRWVTQRFRTGPQSDSHCNDPSLVPYTG
jgi:hypothetical protein